MSHWPRRRGGGVRRRDDRIAAGHGRATAHEDALRPTAPRSTAPTSSRSRTTRPRSAPPSTPGNGAAATPASAGDGDPDGVPHPSRRSPPPGARGVPRRGNATAPPRRQPPRPARHREGTTVTGSTSGDVPMRRRRDPFCTASFASAAALLPPASRQPGVTPAIPGEVTVKVIEHPTVDERKARGKAARDRWPLRATRDGCRPMIVLTRSRSSRSRTPPVNPTWSRCVMDA